MIPTLQQMLDNAVQLHQAGKLDQAEILYQQILQIDPRNAIALHLIGMIEKQRGEYDKAIAHIRLAVSVEPDFPVAYHNLGLLLVDLGKFAEAIASFEHALIFAPDYANVHSNLWILRMLTGDFARGGEEFEWCRRNGTLDLNPRKLPQPIWEGETLPNGTILLHVAQGLGDTIQFVRFAEFVKERVGTVLCECRPVLTRLLRSCAGIDRIIPLGEPLPHFDVYAPIMRLARTFKTTVETIPNRNPYLHADGTLTEMQARALAPLTGFKIGIAWQGDPRKAHANLSRMDRNRSIRLSHFEPLARVPGVHLVSLQKGIGSEQIAELADRFPVTDLGRTCEDFSDTANVMKHLDLVISVDSSPVHLAGALGVPVWVAVPFVGCWRWLTEREDSPWYPSVRLFRQTTGGDWPGVFERMARELRARVAIG